MPKTWNESEHPRDHGKFAVKERLDSLVENGGSDEDVTALLDDLEQMPDDELASMGESGPDRAVKRRQPGYLDTPEGRDDFNRALAELRAPSHEDEGERAKEQASWERHNAGIDADIETQDAIYGGMPWWEAEKKKLQELRTGTPAALLKKGSTASDADVEAAFRGHQAQNRERIQAARERAELVMAQRRRDSIRQSKADDHLVIKQAKRELLGQMRELDREEKRIKNERRREAAQRQSTEIRDLIEAIKMQASRPIEVKPVINVPEIKVPAAAPVNVVVEKPDPVVVNVAKPDPVVVNLPAPEQKAYDVIPVRDEDGNVTRYKRVERP